MAVGEYNGYVKPGQIGLLFVEPRQPPSKMPLIDFLTRKMAAALRAAPLPDCGYRGFHVCRCGVFSDNKDHIVDGHFVTNSLAVHYLAFHRAEVPAQELSKVLHLPYEETDPTPGELQDPSGKRIPFRDSLQPPTKSFNGSFADFLKQNAHPSLPAR